jgi:polar amino acid transport system substrate-binding protein/glutamate/aspartate transport system substrate-binding protein
MLRVIALVLTVCALAGAASAQTVDAVKASGKLRIGYRLDAVPFSYRNDSGQPAGYTVDLCRLVAEGVKRSLNLKELDIVYVPVSTEERFEAVRSKKIDMLCGATTVTLSRRELVDFSVLTFFTGASVMVRAGGPASFSALAGKTIAVRTGTTTENALTATRKNDGIAAKVVGVKDHAEGAALLTAGKADAYFADQAILFWLATRAGQGKLVVSSSIFRPEPYAIALPLGDTQFRLLVDTQLSAIYQSGAILDTFKWNLGTDLPQVLRTMYLLNALPQ